MTVAVAPGVASSVAAGTPPTARVAVAPILRSGSYDGHDGIRWSRGIAAGGKRVSSFTYRLVRGSCGDGGRVSSAEVGLVRSGAISANGHVSPPHTYGQAFEFNTRGGPITGSEKVTIARRFSGAHLGGVLHDTCRGRGLHRSTGPLVFSAALDGTGNAPLQTAYATTGSYAGLGPFDKLVVLRTFLPRRAITEFTITSREGVCNGGLIESGNDHWHLPILVALQGHTFRVTGQETIRGRHLVARHQLTLYGTLDLISTNPWRYGAHGVWTDSARIYRPGHRVATCTRGQVRIAVTGPSRPTPRPLRRWAATTARPNPDPAEAESADDAQARVRRSRRWGVRGGR